jgi:tetratricopeptide (TPR) repeat protein
VLTVDLKIGNQRMKKPLYQKIIIGFVAAIFGYSFLGALLDATSNAVTLINPELSIPLSIIILIIWITLELILKIHPTLWIVKGQKALISKLGIIPRCALLGAIVLVWIPNIFPFTQEMIERFQSSGKIKILVANFDGIDSKKYRIPEIIRSKLVEATKSYSDIEIKPLNYTITEEEGSEVAQAKGKIQDASIVLWGWYGKTDDKVYVSVHFEVLKKPKHLPLRQEKEIINTAAARLESFELQMQLSSEMSYLTLMTVGLIKYWNNDEDGAIASFSDALAQPKVPEQIIDPSVIYLFRGTSYISKGDLDAGIADLDQAIKINPNDAGSYNNRGLAYHFKGNLEKAISDYDKSIEIDPKGAEPYNNRGLAHIPRHNLDEAIKDFQTALSLWLESAPLYYNNIGMAYYYKEDYENALIYYKKAINLKPDLDIIHCNLGHCLVKKESYEQAISEYSKAISLNSNNTDCYMNRGLTYFKIGQIKLGLADFQKAIDIDPNNADFHIYRGNELREIGETGLAIEDFNQALQIDSKASVAYFRLGQAYMDQGDYDNVISNLNHFLKASPKREEFEAVAYYNRGLAWQKKRQISQAIVDYTIAIQVDPNYKEAYNNRAAAYMLLFDFNKSLEDCNQAIRIKPDYASALLNRGIALLFLGNIDQAKLSLKEALKYVDNPSLQLRIEMVQTLIESNQLTPDFSKLVQELNAK